MAKAILRCFVVSFSGIKSLPAHMSNHCAAKLSSFFAVSIVCPSSVVVIGVMLPHMAPEYKGH